MHHITKVTIEQSEKINHRLGELFAVHTADQELEWKTIRKTIITSIKINQEAN